MSTILCLCLQNGRYRLVKIASSVLMLVRPIWEILEILFHRSQKPSCCLHAIVEINPRGNKRTSVLRSPEKSREVPQKYTCSPLICTHKQNKSILSLRNVKKKFPKTEHFCSIFGNRIFDVF